jgi:hypothetical protein
MRSIGRMILPALAAPIGAALALAHCGTDAVGIESCKKIEEARCEGAKSCGMSDDQSEHCKQFYRDQCLHGIENSDHTPSEQETDACVAAVQATAACAAGHVATMAMCSAAPVSTDAAGLAPCDILMKVPEKLTACAFVAVPTDAGPPPDAPSGDAMTDGAGGGGGGAGGAAGAGGTGGTGGSGGAAGAAGADAG